MSIVRDIESDMENIQNEMKWLKQRIEETESNYINDEEIDFSIVCSQYEDVDTSVESLVSRVKDLVETLKDLI